MRPTLLDILFADATTLPGIGPKLGKILGEFTGDKIIDLLFHLPSNLIDRQYRPSLAEVEDGRIATFEVEVMKHEAPEGAICLIAFYAAMRPAICLWCFSMRAVTGWAKPCPKGQSAWCRVVLSGFANNCKSFIPTICCRRPNLINYRLSSRFIR